MALSLLPRVLPHPGCPFLACPSPLRGAWGSWKGAEPPCSEQSLALCSPQLWVLSGAEQSIPGESKSSWAESLWSGGAEVPVPLRVTRAVLGTPVLRWDWAPPTAPGPSNISWTRISPTETPGCCSSLGSRDSTKGLSPSLPVSVSLITSDRLEAVRER